MKPSAPRRYVIALCSEGLRLVWYVIDTERGRVVEAAPRWTAAHAAREQAERDHPRP